MYSLNNSPRVARLVSYFVGALLCISSVPRTGARDLFEVHAVTTDGGPLLDHTAGSSSLLDLIQSAVGVRHDFASFDNRGFDASLQYAGVDNAMKFTVNNAGTAACLQIPSTDFVKTFTGATRQSVNSQIVDFLERDGQAEYAKFLKAMNRQSTVAVSDGNPNSSTAMIASQAFTDYATTPGETRAERDSPADAVRTSFGVVADIGSFTSRGISGTSYSLPISARFKLSDRVGLGVAIPLNYTEIEGAQIFSAGLTLALPVKIVVRSDNNPWGWQVTPSGGVLASASKDMLAGGMIGQVGISSMLTYDFRRFSLSMGNYFGWYEGIPITFNDVAYDPNISQQITKNGLKASVPIKQHWVFEVYGIHTKFLEAAAVDQYFTVGGDIGWRSKSTKSYWSAGIYSDISDKYTSVRAKFGTSWKF